MSYDNIQSEDLDVGGLKGVELRLTYTLTYSALTVTLQLKSNQRIAREKKRAFGLVTSARQKSRKLWTLHPPTNTQIPQQSLDIFPL